jgi:hypothetical protein
MVLGSLAALGHVLYESVPSHELRSRNIVHSGFLFRKSQGEEHGIKVYDGVIRNHM